jgi:hypothetical protein
MAGHERASFGVSYRTTSYDSIDGRNLRDGTLLSTASVLRGESTPFDIETVSLRIRADTMTFTGSYGITDRLDISAGVPFVRLNLEASASITYRGRTLLQARGSATAAGLGDVVLRTRFNMFSDGASGVSVGAEVRLPTGREEICSAQVSTRSRRGSSVVRRCSRRFATASSATRSTRSPTRCRIRLRSQASPHHG